LNNKQVSMKISVKRTKHHWL